MNEDPNSNPYSHSPTAASLSAPPVHDGEFSAGELRALELFAPIFSAFRKNWLCGSLQFFFFISMLSSAFLISYALTILTAGAGLAADSQGLAGVGVAVQLGAAILNSILQTLIGFGGTWIAYMAMRAYYEDRPLPLDAVIQGFKSFAPLLIMGFLRWLIYFALTLPGMAIIVLTFTLGMGGDFSWEKFFTSDDSTNNILIVSGMAFALIFLPMMYVMIRLSMAELIAVEHGRNPIQAFQDSWSLTNGNVGSIIGFMVLWVLLVLVLSPFLALGAFLTCALGFLPMGFLLLIPGGAMYHQLTKHIPRPSF